MPVATAIANAPQRYDVQAGSASVYNLVTNGWNNAQAYANEAVNRAFEYLTNLQQLADVVSNLPTVDATIGVVDQVIDALVLPDPPGDITTLPDQPVANIPQFQWGEGLYDSALMDGLRTRLLGWIAFGPSTGLTPAVEGQLWERARAREHVATSKRITSATSAWAARGWRRPPGALASEIGMALHDEQVALSGASREIMIKAAELEQSNLQFSFSKGIEIENIATRQHSEMQTRALDAAKSAVTIVAEVYKAHIDAYRAQIGAIVDLFKGRADVFRAVVDGRSGAVRAQADVYKAKAEVVQIEAKTKIEVAQANLQTLVQKVTLIGDAIKAGAQMSAQIAASALSAVNLSGGVSASVGQSHSLNDSISYNNSVSASTSTAVSASTSRSVNVSTGHNTSQSVSQSTNASTSSITSNSLSQSVSQSASISNSTSNSTSNSAVTSNSVSHSTSKNDNNNRSTSTSANYSFSEIHSFQHKDD